VGPLSTHAPIPLLVLTGFLGSGKTTLLAKLVQRPRGERLAVLVNEVGALSLDPWLLEQVDEDVWTLPSGCLCCALRGDLYRALERVAARRPSRVVLETSGLADPAPILHALHADERLAARLRCAGLVAVVDALRAEDLLATQPEARRQLELADRVVLTKPDLAPQRLDGARALLAARAPGCEVRVALQGEVDPEWLLHGPALGRVAGAADARDWLHHHPSGPDGEATFSARTVELEGPVDVDVVALWLRLVAQLDGPRLLRVKILAEDRATGALFALQSAGRLVSAPRRLAARPPDVRGLRLVLVERGLDPATLERLIESLHAAARADPYAPRALGHTS